MPNSKSIILSVCLAALSGAAQAQGANFFCVGEMAYGRATVVTALDAGRPGFVALVAKQGENYAYLDSANVWRYSNVPTIHDYRIFTSLPPSYDFEFCVPRLVYADNGEELACTSDSSWATGVELYVTYGAITPQIQADANAKEQRFEALNQRLISVGKQPRPPFDKMNYMQQAALADARTKNYKIAGIVPLFDCRPPETGGN